MVSRHNVISNGYTWVAIYATEAEVTRVTCECEHCQIALGLTVVSGDAAQFVPAGQRSVPVVS
jgi:hypothetical protein